MAMDQVPTGKQISEKAKAAKLDSANSATAEKRGKKSTFIPAQLHDVRSIDELEQGQFIGVVDTEIEGDKANLPPGQYNLFLAKVGNDWHVYAESGGNIVAEAASVVERKDTPKNMKPQFREGSFCWWVWLIITGFEWCF